MEQEGQAQEQPDSEESTMAALTGYLDAEEKKEEPEEAKPEVKAEAEPEEEEKKPEQTIELDPEAAIFELTVKGEGGADVEKKVSLKELQAGYMMQADYQRKTQEVAKERAELHKQVKDKTEPVIQNYERQLHVLGNVVSQLAAPELKDVNWVELANNDPAKFVALKAKAEHFQSVMQSIASEQNKLAQQRGTEQKEARDKAASEAVETLKAKIPGWNNDKYQSILKGSMEKYGFKADEVTNVVDARIIEVLNDALAYRELKTAKPIADKKVVSIPKVVRPGSPEKDSDQTADRKKAALTKLRKSGDVEHAAEALYSMIE